MRGERLILCGGAGAPKGRTPALRLQLDPRSRERNIDLKLSDISKKLVKNLPDSLIDLIELATYVYCADQMFSRGGDLSRGEGTDWRRALRFVVPARCPDQWSSAPVSEALRNTLGFLSDEEFAFEFCRLPSPVPVTEYFDFGPDEGQGAKVEDVLLFSGGLDSLAGVVREAVVGKRRVALVSHRSTSKTAGYREELVAEVGRLCRGRPPYHIPVWAHKVGLKSRENTQRTRTFLYASLATAVARLYGLNRIRFYENGITSLNLPITAQLIGSRASRSTHPQTLRLFSRLFTLIMGHDFSVENPGFWHTKAELVDEIGEAGAARLINRTRSCHHTQDSTILHTHCGRCSQCLTRRFATLASKHASEDHKDKYKSDPLISPTKKGPDQALAEGFPRTALEIEAMSASEFCVRYGELKEALDALEGADDKNSRRVFDLHLRHSRQVLAAIARVIGDHASRISRRKLAPSSVVGMVLYAGAAAAPSTRGKETSEIEYFHPSSDYRTILYKGNELSVRPAASRILQVMHEEFVLTRVPTVSASVLAQATCLEGDLLGHLRHCRSIWRIIVGPGGKGKVRFLVLPSPDSREMVFRSEA